jgi:hypothetical protein
MGTLHGEPNAFFENVSLSLNSSDESTLGYYGSKAIAIPKIHFTAVNDLTKDDTTISHFKQ